MAPELAPASQVKAAGPAYIVLAGISFSHFLNDTMQSLIASVYPILKDSYALNFAQIGMITLAFQFTASLLQPVVGHFTDKKAQPFSLAVGMGSTFFGLLLLSVNPKKVDPIDRKSTRLNSSHMSISYAVFCLKKKKIQISKTFRFCVGIREYNQ